MVYGQVARLSLYKVRSWVCLDMIWVAINLRGFTGYLCISLCIGINSIELQIGHDYSGASH